MAVARATVLESPRSKFPANVTGHALVARSPGPGTALREALGASGQYQSTFRVIRRYAHAIKSVCRQFDSFPGWSGQPALPRLSDLARRVRPTFVAAFSGRCRQDPCGPGSEFVTVPAAFPARVGGSFAPALFETGCTLSGVQADRHRRPREARSMGRRAAARRAKAARRRQPEASS